MLLATLLVGCARSDFADREVSRCFPTCAPAVEPVVPTLFALSGPPAIVGLTASADGVLSVMGNLQPTDASPPELTVGDQTTTASAVAYATFVVRRTAAGEAGARLYASSTGSIELAASTTDGVRSLACGNIQGTVDVQGTAVASNGAPQAPLIIEHDSELELERTLVLPTTIQNGQCKAISVRDGVIAMTALVGGTVDPGGGIITSGTDPNTFIALYDASTFAPRWQLGLIAGNQVFAETIDLAADGGVYASGRFAGVVDFGPPAFASVGIFDGYFIRYSSTGAYRWSFQVAGAGDELILRAAPIASGICFCGHTTSPSLDVGTRTIATSGHDVFVGCVDDAGTTLWARALQLAGDGTCGSVLVDADGRLLVAGTATAGADFGGGATDVDAGFVAAYDTTGGLVGLQRFDTGTSIDGLAQSAGDVWATGRFTSELTVDGVSYPNDAPAAGFIAPVRLSAP